MVLKNRSFLLRGRLGSLLVAALATGSAFAAQSQTPKQPDLIKVLESTAPPQDKAIACKQLAVYGGKEAVPALAVLLPNPDLSSWARIALEAIPDPAAGDALRDALEKTQGRLLIGVINSVGLRHDTKAVKALSAKIESTDAGVASAAAEALGRIGGDEAGKTLQKSLATAAPGAKAAVAEGCVLCAESFLAAGKGDAAVKLYDAVRKADVPKNKQLQATRGAILARGTAGLPLLLEQLKSADKAAFALGLRVARELPGEAVTKALAAEFERAAPDRQPLLVVMLGDRRDSTVLPAVAKALERGEKATRLAAVRALDRIGTPSTATCLLTAAGDGEAEVAQAAKAVLTRISGHEVDAEVIARLPKASGKARQALIEVAGLRSIQAALPSIAAFTDDPDVGVRNAAVGAIGALGTQQQAGDLARLLQNAGRAGDRADLEKAFLAICARLGSSCMPSALSLAQSSDSSLRKIALHAMSSIGGPAALNALTAAVEDKDEGVQDEAVRALSTWTSNWPDDSAVAEPLLKLAKSGKKPTHQVLGLRGYLQYVQNDAKLADDDKVAKLRDLMPLLSRPEDKRLAIPVIASIPTGGALELLMTCAGDAAAGEEACMALANLAARTNLKGAPKELRETALRTVLDKAQDARTKKKAEDALKKLQ